MGESQEVELFETLVPLAGLAALIAIGVVLLVSQFQRSLFRQRLQQENLKTEHQQALLRTSIAVQEKERERIARDLHDEMGSRLSLAAMQLKQLNGTALPSPSEDLVTQVLSHVESALENSKRISYDLLPPILVDLGLHKALNALVREVGEATDLDLKLSSEVNTDQLPWDVQLGLYRMVAELLQNTVKHAEATRVALHLNNTPHGIQLQYRDNGKGLPDTSTRAGLGLKNLDGRTSALNGTLEWGNHAEGGFYATIELPVGPES